MYYWYPWTRSPPSMYKDRGVFWIWKSTMWDENISISGLLSNVALTYNL